MKNSQLLNRINCLINNFKVKIYLIMLRFGITIYIETFEAGKINNYGTKRNKKINRVCKS